MTTTIVIITKKFSFYEKTRPLLCLKLWEFLFAPSSIYHRLRLGDLFFTRYASNLTCYPRVGMVFFRDSSLRSIYIELIKGGVRNFSEEILDEDLKTKARE